MSEQSVTPSVRKRKSSLRITLVLIGAAGLTACGGSNEPQMRRDTYASLADCKADWHREELCEQAPASTSSSTGHGTTGSRYYYGPSYRSSSTSSSPPSGSRAISSTTVSRGGFGSSSSFHGSSSS